jgi:TatD DNase family protein
MRKNEQINQEPETNLPLIDTHCHVPWTDKPKDPEMAYDKQIERFFSNGGKYLISCSVDMKTTNLIRNYKQKIPRMGFTPGFAPQTVTYTPPKEMKDEFNIWNTYLHEHPEEYLGIGEIGLDFHHAKTLQKREEQIRMFKMIITSTKDLKKPYILHVRNPTENDRDKTNPNHIFNQPDVVNRIILEILEREQIQPNRVVWHCFSGPVGWGEKLANQGFFISVPSSAYGFQRWRKNLTNIPLEKLFTETDSSYQHPYDMGGFNEPYNVRYSIAAIASIINLSQLQIAEAVVKNIANFYALTL